MIKSFKRKLYILLDPTEGDTRLDYILNLAVVSLIIVNTLAVILETVQEIYLPNQKIFRDLEVFSVYFFLIEFLLRLWTITENKMYKDPIRGRIRFIFSVGSLIDIFTILPFFLPLLLKVDLRFLRMLRLVRFLRFFKLERYLNATAILKRVFKAKKEELTLSLIILIFLVIFASSLMYFFENSAQPDKFSSIPGTMWWSVATLTTVGYGDVYPITGMGKLLTAVISVLGIGMFALPTGILASGFAEEFNRRKKVKPTCPHCGKEI